MIKKLYGKYFSLTLLAAVLLGLVVGLLLGESAGSIAWLGTIFTRLLTMLVPVLVFFSIASSLAKIGDAKRLTRWAGKVIGWFVITTSIATIIGIVIGLIFKPGVGISIPDANTEVTSVSIDNFIAWLQANIVGCITEGNTIQIVFAALFIGVAVVFMPRCGSQNHKADESNFAQFSQQSHRQHDLGGNAGENCGNRPEVRSACHIG